MNGRSIIKLINIFFQVMLNTFYARNIIIFLLSLQLKKQRKITENKIALVIPEL